VRDRLPGRILAASILVLVATPVAVWAARPDPDVGSVPHGIVASGAASPTPVVTTQPATVGIAIPAVAVRSARLADYRPPPRGVRPVRLTIESIGVRASVVPVGVEGGGSTVEVPSDVGTIGWYRFGPAPGASGSAVLIGHVDSHVQGAGAFFRLRELGPGDHVTVYLANGSRSAFEVVARRSYPKGKLPGSVFRRDGEPILTLVTCGGAFDPVARSYADNVVVFAVPVA